MSTPFRRDGGAPVRQDELPHDDPAMPEHVGHNIQTIAELFAQAERRVGRHQLAIERVTDVVGRPATTYILLVAFVAWTVGNGLAGRLGMRPFDPPPFPWLQSVTCIAALLMTVTILTTQNRAAKLARHRAYLDLQVNLIAEGKIAKLVGLLEELRRDLPSVENRTDAVAEAMTEAVDLHAVAKELDAIQGTADLPVSVGARSDGEPPGPHPGSGAR
jgi:uncharacterized membrane protein